MQIICFSTSFFNNLINFSRVKCGSQIDISSCPSNYWKLWSSLSFFFNSLKQISLLLVDIFKHQFCFFLLNFNTGFSIHVILLRCFIKMDLYLVILFYFFTLNIYICISPFFIFFFAVFNFLWFSLFGFNFSPFPLILF